MFHSFWKNTYSFDFNEWCFKKFLFRRRVGQHTLAKHIAWNMFHKYIACKVFAAQYTLRKWGVSFQNAMSPKIQNRENCKNVADSVLLHLERSVMHQMKSGTVEWRFTLPSHFLITPIIGKEGSCEKILRFVLNTTFWCNGDEFINVKCGSKCNIAHLRWVIMKKT